VDLETLQKIFRLEAQKGYLDTAVIGGIDRFLDNWTQHNLIKPSTPTETSLLKRIVSRKVRYSSMSPEERKTWIGQLGKIITPKSTEAASTPRPKRTNTPAKTIKDNQPISASLESPVTILKGISTVYAEKLARLGVKTIRDMLFLFPFRHLDYSRLKTISQLTEGQEETIIANIWEVRKVNIGGRPSTEAILGDSTGNIRAVWFNNPYLVRQLTGSSQIVLSGRVRFFNGRPVYESPDWEFLDSTEELIHAGRLVPVYPLTKGLHQRALRKTIKSTVDQFSGFVKEYLPANIINRNNLLPVYQAINQAHFPDSIELKDRARIRLAFDELFLLQLGVLKKKKQWQVNKTSPIKANQRLLSTFVNGLPYELTAAQKRVINEILGDLALDIPMSRLLQGEVGSGKTIVALVALLATVATGRQASLMAPTEILAQQHFKAVTNLLESVFGPALNNGNSNIFEIEPGINAAVTLLTSDIKPAAKREIKENIANGSVNIIIGTHAIIQEEVTFKDLGFLVIDEQHRFGVLQRQALRKKGDNPHVLVMTATPIPRTLALTLYGDLDLSVIDELPPGRQIIKTRWLKPEETYKAYNFIRKQVSEGRQVFIICPLVEESDSLQAKAATQEYERLSREIFPNLRIGLLHGRMKAAEKEKVMKEFHSGTLEVLVATPVVEVGIDVPNATVILIQSANRFGLSQLHQFRGRVGRGAYQSYCMLLAENTTEIGAERLKAIEELHDGFKLAEKDLELRGPGEFFGTRQSGIPDLKMARLSDVPLLELPRREAISLFSSDPSLEKSGHALLSEELKRVWQNKGTSIS
jgi:ATP-dependent DNA helicase RecG